MTSGLGLASMVLPQGQQCNPKMAEDITKEATDRQRQLSEVTTVAPMSRNCTEDTSTATPSPMVLTDWLDEEDAMTSLESEGSRKLSRMWSGTFSPWPTWDSTRYELSRVLRSASMTWPCQIEIHFDKMEKRNVLVKRFTTDWIQMQTNLQEALSLEKAGGQPPLDPERLSTFQDCYNNGGLLLLCDQDFEECLFDHCNKMGPPGPAREFEALRILRSLLQLTQELPKAHGRIRAESVWLKMVPADGADGCKVLLSDFGALETGALRGDTVFLSEAPSSFATDLFSCGVLGYCLAMGRYPWFSTLPGKCKAFGFVRDNGIRRFLADKRCPASKEGRMSAEYKEILSCLLETDPSLRQCSAMSY